VAERPAKEARRYVASGVPLGAHVADRLLPLLAIGAGGSFRTLPLSRHALTNIEVIGKFTNCRIAVADEGREVVRVDVGRE
jgi:RNA 3'-terminal phosphate cyclase (ATP)